MSTILDRARQFVAEHAVQPPTSTSASTVFYINAANPCADCGRDRFWRTGGTVRCNTCHPHPWAPAGGQSPDESSQGPVAVAPDIDGEQDDAPAPTACHACKCDVWWIRPSNGERICGVCHPNPQHDPVSA